MATDIELTVSDYRTLIEVLQRVGASLDVDKILQELISVAIELCSADQASIMLVSPAGGHEAKTLIRQKLDKGHLDHTLNLLLLGWVQRHRSSLLTHEIAGLSRQKQFSARHLAIASVLSVPLLHQDQIIGAVNLISLSQERRFSQRELMMMEILAKQCTHLIVNARLHETVFAEAERLRKQARDKYSFDGIIGQSTAMQKVFSILERVMPTDAQVLLQGESGTGKERIASVIHYAGPRKDKPFVAVDCGALPANLLESELFGYVKGAFTGADRNKKGLFEESDGGTLFLDEISNMPLEIQSKFLRAIQEGEIRPLGSNQSRKIDTRIIAASQNLRASVEAGEFREDLFYRLNVVPIALPALRDRAEDIIILADHFLCTAAQKYGKSFKGFDVATISAMEAYQWPGNVRELQNAVERMVILAPDDIDYLGVELLPEEITEQSTASGQADLRGSQLSSVKDRKKALEIDMLRQALNQHGWNQSAAARQLGIAESTLRYKIQKYGLQPSR